MSRGAEQIDYRLVERMRAQGASWSACARANAVSEDLVRRHCDTGYERPDLTEAAERCPKLASGRENRPGLWAEPVPIREAGLPPCSNANRVPRPEPAEEPSILVLSMPTADAVARAVVAAARSMGEDPLALGGGKPRPRFRFAAYVALKAQYPGATNAVLGRLTAIPDPDPAKSLNGIRRLKWWPRDGVAAIDAALEALDEAG